MAEYCPRCKGLLLKDYDALYCIACGYQKPPTKNIFRKLPKKVLTFPKKVI